MCPVKVRAVVGAVVCIVIMAMHSQIVGHMIPVVVVVCAGCCLVVCAVVCIVVMAMQSQIVERPSGRQFKGHMIPVVVVVCAVGERAVCSVCRVVCRASRRAASSWHVVTFVVAVRAVLKVALCFARRECAVV